MPSKSSKKYAAKLQKDHSENGSKLIQVAGEESKSFSQTPFTTASFVVITIAMLLSAYYYYFPADNNNKTIITTVPESAPIKVFGFLPDYRYEAFDFELILPRLTDLCLFSSEADRETGKIIERLPKRETMNLIKRISRTGGQRIFIAFGGAGRSGFFGPVLGNETTYGKFKKQLIELLNREELDGIELNWMYPSNSREISSLERLVKDVKRERPNTIVTMAVPPDVRFLKAVSKINFDYFHIMAYQAGIGGPDPIVLAKNILHAALQELAANKITLGIPFYGTRGADAITYEEFVSKRLHNDVDILMESSRVLKEKISLIKQLDVLGVSIWELGQDCRVRDVGTHIKTCPNGAMDSLIFQIT
jgi:spore germination protein YaaH